ncbi:MAG: TetR/AcrR family transcriptional regulator [bacterium]|nr:TetR/AcrR family transcriptional regulator [bacterium]
MSASAPKKRSAKKSKAGPRERLLETAAELFYRQGYSVTGINQVIAESGTHKASFYRYFETKEDLALAYLEMRGEYFHALLARLTERAQAGPTGGARASNLESFAQSWVNFTLREVRQGRFYGCPLANFRGQVPEPDERQAALLRSIIDGWLGVLADFLRGERDREGGTPLSASPESIAIQFLKIYEGSAQLYRLTGNDAYLRSMKAEMLAAARRPTSTQRT